MESNSRKGTKAIKNLIEEWCEAENCGSVLGVTRINGTRTIFSKS